MKTILKLHQNGNFETLGVNVVKDTLGPNLMDPATMIPGYVTSDGRIEFVPGSDDKTTPFISVSSEEIYTLQSVANDGYDGVMYVALSEFDANYNFIKRNTYIDQSYSISLRTNWTCPQGVSYVRISFFEIQNYTVSFKHQRSLSLSLSENSVTLPRIIELPPPGYRNYFIEKESEIGWLSGVWIQPPNEADHSSGYVDVRGWDSFTVRIRFINADGRFSTWVSVLTYDEAKSPLGNLYDGNATEPDPFTGNYEWVFKRPVNFAYLRVSTTYYNRPGVTVKISIERGDTNNSKHYLAPEDLPSWAVDTGNPISITPRGIVIKGSLIQSP